MAKTREQKTKILNDLSAGLKSGKGAVFINFQGLKIDETDELRKKCREQKVTFVASKKTILKKALSEMGLDVDTKAYEGGVSVLIGKEDEVTPAQVYAEFAKKHEKTYAFGGILEGKYIDAKMVNTLSKLPNKQQMLGQLVGTLNAPISGFVNALAGNVRNLVNVLNNIKEAKV